MNVIRDLRVANFQCRRCHQPQLLKAMCSVHGIPLCARDAVEFYVTNSVSSALISNSPTDNVSAARKPLVLRIIESKCHGNELDAARETTRLRHRTDTCMTAPEYV